MLDIIKMSVKVAAIAGVLAALVIIIGSIQVPAINAATLTGYINSVYSIAVHWCPVIGTLYTTAIVFIGINLTLLLFRAGLFAFKAIMTVFE